MCNLLTSIAKFADNSDLELHEALSGNSNRANATGDKLEEFVKKFLSHSLGEADSSNLLERYSEIYSYTGNKNNPPDVMYRGGDAFEVKKVEGEKSRLSLNSSFPKNKLYVTDSKISKDCQTCEEWTEKDIFYIVGTVPKNSTLKYLWIVQGSCYAASSSCYQRVIDAVSSGLSDLTELDLVETNELGGVKNVDPMGITNLRVRGMWGIDHPSSVFDYIYSPPENASFCLVCLMLKEKYDSLNVGNVLENVEKEDVRVKNPDNPSQLLDAVKITVEIV